MTLTRRPFVFLRHGESECNRHGIIGGRTDTPLTEQGRDQARRAAPLLDGPWSQVACSELSRTRDTAALAVPGCEPLILPGLNERDWGDLEGQPLDQLVPYKATPPGGEPWERFEQRIVVALNALLEQWDTPLVVGHSGVYRVICSQVLGRPDGPRIANADPVRIQPDGDTWRLSHLRSDQ